jgi:E3 ubiquitin-protein ligase SIAH1
MFHACDQKFNVTKNLENFCELNKADWKFLRTKQGRLNITPHKLLPHIPLQLKLLCPLTSNRPGRICFAAAAAMPPRHRERRGRSLSSAEEEGGGTKTSATCSEKPGQERRAQMAAEMVGGPKEGGEGDAGRPDSEIFAKLDPRLLDCIICSEPLRPPIFQVITTRTICCICC